MARAWHPSAHASQGSRGERATVADENYHFRRRTLPDFPAAFAGLVLAVLVHMAVALFALRAGAAEGNVAREQTGPTQDEEIIEGALLRQGGGGEFDPRRMVHRQPPIRAEERARAEQAGLNRNADPNRVVADDAGVRRDPTALATDRDILGRGNQDLAERLNRLAQSETESAPGTMPGPGAPDGSINGSETDPNRAGHGAQAKLQSFLQRHLHLLATAPASAHHAFRLRVVLSSDGTSVASGSILEGSGDDTTDSDLQTQLSQLAETHATIPELTDEEKASLAGHSYRVRYNPD
jgi:hypothetical protein